MSGSYSGLPVHRQQHHHHRQPISRLDRRRQAIAVVLAATLLCSVMVWPIVWSSTPPTRHQGVKDSLPPGHHASAAPATSQPHYQRYLQPPLLPLTQQMVVAVLPQAWSRWLLAVPVTASESSTFLWRLPSAALLQPPTLPNYNTAGVDAESASSVADRIVAEVMAPWRSTNSSSRRHAIELANVIAAPARRRECVLIHIDATRQVAVHYGPNRRHILTSAVYSQRLAFFVQLLQLTMEAAAAAAASAHGGDNSAATPPLQLPQVFSFCAGDCVTSQTSHRHDYVLVPDTANASTTTQPTWWRRWAAAAARTCSSTDSSASTLPLATLGVVACQGSASLPVPVAMRGGPPAQWDNVTTAFASASKEATPPWNERPRVAVFRGAARSTLVRPWTCGNTDCDSSVQASNSTWRWGGRTRVLVQAAKAASSASASAGERVGDSLDLGFSPGGQGGPGLVAAMQQASGINLHGGASMVEQQGRGRYTLDLAGHCGWADRLALLLFGSAAVIRQETPCAEWYVLGLQPWRHYAPVDYLLDSLPTTLAWLQRHDKEAQAMVQAAQTYARTVLSLQGQMTYLSRLLRAYTAATLFTAEEALQEAQELYGEHWHWVRCGSAVQRHDETVAPVDLAVVGDVCGEDWSLRTWLQ